MTSTAKVNHHARARHRHRHAQRPSVGPRNLNYDIDVMQLELKASAEESDIKSQVKWRRRERTEMGDGRWRGWGREVEGVGDDGRGWGGAGGRASETAWEGWRLDSQRVAVCFVELCYAQSVTARLREQCNPSCVTFRHFTTDTVTLESKQHTYMN